MAIIKTKCYDCGVVIVDDSLANDDGYDNALGLLKVMLEKSLQELKGENVYLSIFAMSTAMGLVKASMPNLVEHQLTCGM